MPIERPNPNETFTDKKLILPTKMYCATDAKPKEMNTNVPRSSAKKQRIILF